MPFNILSGVGSVLGGLGGLFGSTRKQPDPRKNLLSQAQGAREAAERYGFNPLTMLQYGQPGGAMGGGGAPPLASVALMSDGFRELDDYFSGDADRRRAADQLKLDLAKLEIENLRGGRAADALGGASPLGRNAATVPTAAGSKAAPFSMGSPIATGRKVKPEELSNTPGVFVVENDLTEGPVTIPGDSEPWGIDELLTAVVVGGPQVVRNHAISHLEEKQKQRTENPTWWNRRSRMYDGILGAFSRN